MNEKPNVSEIRGAPLAAEGPRAEIAAAGGHSIWVRRASAALALAWRKGLFYQFRQCLELTRPDHGEFVCAIRDRLFPLFAGTKFSWVSGAPAGRRPS